MRRITFLIILAVIGITNLPGLGQDSGRDTLDRAIPSVKELLLAAERGDTDAILQLGREREEDQAVVALLSNIRSNSKYRNFGSPFACAQMALARLGDNEAMAEILAEVESVEPGIQDYAIRKLAYVGSPRAVEILVSLLENDEPRKTKEWRGPNGEKPLDKLIYYPINIMALRALAEIMPNPIVVLGKREFPTQEDVRRWLEWWESTGESLKEH